MIFKKRWSFLLTMLAVFMVGQLVFSFDSVAKASSTNGCGCDRGIDLALVFDNSGSIVGNDPTRFGLQRLKI